MSRKIVIADTGLGNVRSVVRALEEASKKTATITVSSDAEAIARADALVVPGQGAFRDCATALGKNGLGEAIRASIARGTQYLGICLGMQALFATSAEAPGCAGLGIFPGTVVKLRGDRAIKIPHVGWNTVEPARETWLLPRAEYFYFVHSYVVAPESPELACGTTVHGERFVSAIEKDNVAAVQFHPEKSQRAGIAMLERFLSR
jgi:imidazole glycerol-phosphate synthase subunit HisH